MNGFDQEWLTNHTRKTGARATVQAGVGALAGVPVKIAPGQPAPGTAPFQIYEAVDPFAVVDTSAGVTLVLPYPISANRYWRPVRIGEHITIVPTKEAKAYKADVQKRALLAGVRKPILGRVTIAVELYPHRPLDWAKRAAKLGDAWSDTVQCIDLDNANKVLMDSLRGVAIEDDKWVRKIVAERMEPDANPARVVVTIKPIARVVVQEGLL